MKICHVINDLSRGGAETHLYSLVKLQIEGGYDVSILLLGKDQLNFVSLENQFSDLNVNLLRFKGPKKMQGINPLSIYRGIGYFKNNKFLPTIIVPKGGILVPRNITAEAEEMIQALQIIISKIPENEEINFLNNEQMNELLNWDAESYRVSLSENKA